MRRVLNTLGIEAFLAGLGASGIVALALALAIVIGLIGAGFALRAQVRRTRDPELMAATDRQGDPRRGWVQGATFILQRGWDNAYGDPEVIRQMLKEAWGLNTAAELEAQVAELREGEKNSWTLLRAMLLVRSVVAVGWMSNDASFELCYAIGRELQQLYPSWQALGDDALRRRRAWRGVPEDGSADDEGMREVAESAAELSRTHWRQIPWGLPLT